MKILRRCSAVLALAPLTALAHPGHDGHDFTWDFNTGLTHPFTGWDHLLAMLAVGLWAAQLGGRARWLIPATFVAAMGAGAVLGRLGLAVPAVEQGIAASVLVLGLLIARSVRLSFATNLPLVATFAAFHGLAHAAEMPATATALGYGSGLLLATSFLHAVGLGLGLAALSRRVPPRATASTGWAIAASGVLLLAL